jgi:hypothetical protein
MNYPVFMWQQRMPRHRAEELLAQYHEAFKTSGCRSCPGICCEDCAREDGYLHRMGISDSHLRRLKRQHGWNATDGFKGPEGCKLPVERRSPTCIAFYCGSKLNGFMANEVTPGTRAKGPDQERTLLLVGRLRERLEKGT